MIVTLPQLYTLQHDAFFNDARIAVTEASTKAGKTVGAIAWQSSSVLRDTLQLNHWWVAPYHGTTEIAYRRAKRMYRGVWDRSNDSDKFLTFRNGSRWLFKSAEKPDTLYGEDVGTVVGDEYTRMREEAFHAIVSTLTATEGQMRLIGNVYGRGWGYKIARAAEGGAPGMVYTRITADDAIAAGVLSQETVDHARRVLPDHIFRELYYCEASDNGNPFGMANINACIGEASNEPTVAFGVDLAKKQDYTTIIGMDANKRWTFADRWSKMDWGLQIDKLASIIGSTPALVDSTGVGDPIVEELQRRCYNVEGFKFSRTSKQQLMEGLASQVHQHAITMPDGAWANEMRTFEYEVTRTGVFYSAPDGTDMHDDCVCSLALAVKAVNDMPQATPSIATRPVYTSQHDRVKAFLEG